MYDSKILKLSKYLNIISNLISVFEFKSLFKTVITAFVIYQQEEKISFKSLKNNMLEGFLSQFHSELLLNYKDFDVIFEVLNILENNDYVQIVDDLIRTKKKLEYISDDYMQKTNVSNVLYKIENMNINSFVQEVIYNV